MADRYTIREVEREPLLTGTPPPFLHVYCGDKFMAELGDDTTFAQRVLDLLNDNPSTPVAPTTKGKYTVTLPLHQQPLPTYMVAVDGDRKYLFSDEALAQHVCDLLNAEED